MDLMTKLQNMIDEANEKLASNTDGGNDSVDDVRVPDVQDTSIAKTAEDIIAQIDEALEHQETGTPSSEANEKTAADDKAEDSLKRAAKLAVLLRSSEEELAGDIDYKLAYQKLAAVRGKLRDVLLGLAGAAIGGGAGIGYAAWQKKKLTDEFAKTLQQDEMQDQENLARAYYMGYNAALEGAQQ